MTRIVTFIFMISVCYSCSLLHQNSRKEKQNCEKCEKYIELELAPQIEYCVEPKESYGDCDLDIEMLKQYGSCLLGMKRTNIEKLIGKHYQRVVKGRDDMGQVLNLKYDVDNQRLIEIREMVSVDNVNKSLDCFQCDSLYDKIGLTRKIKKNNLNIFIEDYRACFFGKTARFLTNELNLDNKKEDPNYHFSYIKKVVLNRDTHQLCFLFNPSYRLTDIYNYDTEFRKNYQY